MGFNSGFKGLSMNVYADGWHWQILHNTSLPCWIWGEALTEGLGYIMWSRTVHSPPPVMTLAASGQEQRNMSQGTDEIRWRNSRLWGYQTLSLNIRLVSVFSSALYVTVAGMSHYATHVHGNATQDTSHGACYTCVLGTVRTCYVFPFFTKYKNNSKFTY